MFESSYQQLSALLPAGCVRENVTLAPYTTMRTGGPAALFAEPRSAQQLAHVHQWAQEKGLPLLILGNGSNLLIADSGFDGLVIHLGRALSEVSVFANTLTAQAGASLAAAARAAAQASLTGLEFAAGIPGSIGGAVCMNAGAYGGEMKDVIESVVVYYIPTQTLTEVKASDCGFEYRRSGFERVNCAIMGAVFKLTPDEPEAIGARMKEMNEKRTASQPLDMPSAGSAFKRPVGGYAAALIDQCGLKGYTVGGAQISTKHAGFAVNTGSATYDDVVALLDHVRREVYDRTQITLEPEIRIYPKGMMLVDNWREKKQSIIGEMLEQAKQKAAESSAGQTDADPG